MSERFAPRLAATVERVAADLDRRGARRAVPLPTLQLPRSFGALLCRVLDEEATGGRAGAARAAALELLYLETLPSLRAAQTLDASAPIGPLFHTPIAWHRLPRLGPALARLFDWLDEAGADPSAVLGARNPSELRERYPTLDALCGATHYGGFLPLLYAYPADLQRGAALLDGGASVEAVVDQLFASPILHELCHFRPERTVELPLYLDECIAALLGVTLLPEMAFPDGSGRYGLYAAPLLYQVGQWMARCFGATALLRLQAGALPARAVLGEALVERLAAHSWREYLERRPLHLLSDNFDPQPWCRLLAGLAADDPWSRLPPLAIEAADLQLWEAALKTMCLEEAQADGTFLVREAPSATPIAIDASGCRVEGGPRLFGQRARYLLSPAIAQALQRRGLAGLELAPILPSDIPDEVERLRRLVVG